MAVGLQWAQLLQEVQKSVPSDGNQQNHIPKNATC